MQESFNGSYVAKKSLGQNFLISPAPIRSMILGAEVNANDTVLEIGPGKGILTKALLETGAYVLVIEKDDRMIPLLQETFAKHIEEGKLEIIHGDALELNMSEKFGNKKYKLIANIPYYITGEIIRKFLEAEHQPETMALLVQKEVAERVVARDGKESILSMSVKVYGTPSSGGKVARTLFRPVPNVDSAILFVKHISKKIFKDSHVSEKRFFEVVKAGFAHKRKQLKNNLKEIISDEKLEAFAQRRAEDLKLEEWVELSR